MRKPSLRERVFHVYRPTIEITKPGDMVMSYATGPIRGKILGIRAPWKLVYFLVACEWPKGDGRGSEEWYTSA